MSLSDEEMANQLAKEMSDITDTVIFGLRAAYPEGVDLARTGITLVSLGAKLLEQSGMPEGQVKVVLTDYINTMEFSEITPVRLDN